MNEEAKEAIGWIFQTAIFVTFLLTTSKCVTDDTKIDACKKAPKEQIAQCIQGVK